MKGNCAVVYFDHVSPWAVDAVKVFEGSWNSCIRYLKKKRREGTPRVYEMDIVPNFEGDVTNANYTQPYNVWEDFDD